MYGHREVREVGKALRKRDRKTDRRKQKRRKRERQRRRTREGYAYTQKPGRGRETDR